MKKIKIDKLYKLLLKIDLLSKSDFEDSINISMMDLIEQLTAMKVFISELVYKLENRKPFCTDFAISKVAIIDEYIEQLEILKIKVETNKNPYPSFE
ncbi:hypothetical protein ACXHQ0_17060 [Vibrio antiquarius]|uniref:Uncharacterized protein n=1 Tax=Vibrio parahaemolyticus TaxID=670 RepID=A0AA46UQJ1_VIBPH|nr:MULTISPECIES: hypothetical protein [Vibrio harveyi group]EGR5926545.1 hypothetical protein [Vibrio parahaemolyticus]KOE92763.1 hypothetical protein ACS91_01730 [Vibrio parahaemolyticus]MCS0310717.1 hypothetical protein [Vibrio diabolicus]UYV30005.1 hypothetical protein M5598_28885 [Vibrio parahaemolyticus]UYW18955.1 hypothetical protein IF561_27405 [Vibrio parahaemolyticus]